MADFLDRFVNDQEQGFEEHWHVFNVGTYFVFQRQRFPEGGYMEHGGRMLSWAKTILAGNEDPSLLAHAKEVAPLVNEKTAGSAQDAIAFFAAGRGELAELHARTLLHQCRWALETIAT